MPFVSALCWCLTPTEQAIPLVVAVSIPSAYACYTIAFNAVGEIIVLKSFVLLEQ